MPLRPTDAEIEAAIVDAAAGLIAQHGVRKASVQAVADAVGYSKGAVLHRFTSKEALQDAAFAVTRGLARDLLAGVRHLDVGPPRDLAVVEALVELFGAHPGAVGLVVAALHGTQGAPVGGLGAGLDDVGQDLLEAFDGVRAVTDGRRLIAVTGCIGALVVASLSLARTSAGNLERWQVAAVVETGFDALGHGALASLGLAPRAGETR